MNVSLLPVFVSPFQRAYETIYDIVVKDVNMQSDVCNRFKSLTTQENMCRNIL